MDVTTHDVLLVGGGGAGLRTALAVSEITPNLKVAVISKVYPMPSHTVSAEGGGKRSQEFIHLKRIHSN